MTNRRPIEERVKSTLGRCGCRSIVVEHLGSGRVKLVGLSLPAVERTILVTAVQTIPGVSLVILDVVESVPSTIVKPNPRIASSHGIQGRPGGVFGRWNGEDIQIV